MSPRRARGRQPHAPLSGRGHPSPRPGSRGRGDSLQRAAASPLPNALQARLLALPEAKRHLRFGDAVGDRLGAGEGAELQQQACADCSRRRRRFIWPCC